MDEIRKSRGWDMQVLTMTELVTLINSYETEDFIIHVEFAGEVKDGQE